MQNRLKDKRFLFTLQIIAWPDFFSLLLNKQTPVDELTIREYPFVTFRTNNNTWVEAAVNYLVDPKQASAIRNIIIKNAVSALLQQSDKVMFPKSNAR